MHLPFHRQKQGSRSRLAKWKLALGLSGPQCPVCFYQTGHEFLLFLLGTNLNSEVAHARFILMRSSWRLEKGSQHLLKLWIQAGLEARALMHLGSRGLPVLTALKYLVFSPQMLTYILSFLPLSDQKEASLVSRAWYCAAQNALREVRYPPHLAHSELALTSTCLWPCFCIIYPSIHIYSYINTY